MKLKKLKRIAKNEDLEVYPWGPLDITDILLKHNYTDEEQPEKVFTDQNKRFALEPGSIEINGIDHELQFNFCTNPLCKWFGKPQKRYEALKNKPSRYIMQQKERSSGEINNRITCKDVKDDDVPGISLNNSSLLVSNWSVADEIRRLIVSNSVVPIDKEYSFHYDGCANKEKSPFWDPGYFWKEGKSSSNSQRYRCKECRKITNVMPEAGECFTYNQQRSDVMVDFTKDLISKVPVRRTCEKNGIGASTYYKRQELLYQKCLEFLERRETEAFKKVSFDEIYINTDTLTYFLNNIRMKGTSGTRSSESIEKRFPTNLITSADVKTGYVFRADIAYDYTIDLDKIRKDTEMYLCDNTPHYLRKNDRFEFSYFPKDSMPRSKVTKRNRLTREDFLERMDYVEGCHVKSTYTTIAQMWLIKQMIHADKWFFVSDDDLSIQSSVFRVFAEEIKNKKAHYFTSVFDDTLSLEEAGKIHFKVREELDNWARYHGYYGKMHFSEIAELYLKEALSFHDFYEYKTINGVKYPIKNKSNPLGHPVTTKDEGIHYINCLTDIRDYSRDDLASILMNVNNWAVDNFFQELRRRISIFERPLVTARGDKKSYIYSNYNPKYAHYNSVIFRTMYNFCFVKNRFGKKETPAQRIGIADRVYDIKDIVYFR